MKRYPTSTPLCGLRGARCGLCPLVLQRGPRTPAYGRQVEQLVHDEPLREKGSNTSQRSPSRRDPGSGGKPGSAPEGAREGRREAGRPCQESRPLQTSTEMHRVASGASPQAANSFAVAGRHSGGCACGQHMGNRPGPSGACAPRQSAVTPAASRQGQLSRFLRVPLPTSVSRARGTVGNRAGQRRSAELRQPLRGSSEFSLAMSGRWQATTFPLKPFASTPRVRDLLGRVPGTPPHQPPPQETRSRLLADRPSQSVFPRRG